MGAESQQYAQPAQPGQQIMMQPQYVQGQPQYAVQGQPQYGVQGQPMMMQQPMMMAPGQQQMTDAPYRGGGICEILAPKQGLIVRQKLDLLDIFMPQCPMKQNKYKVGSYKKGERGEDPDSWEDKKFKKMLKTGKLFTIKEKSECSDRFCCGSYRGFTASVTSTKGAGGGSKVKVAKITRPFKCTMICCCFMINPQEISMEDHNGLAIGRTVYDFRLPDACCLKRRWKVTNGKTEEAQYYLIDDVCCNTNQCAPSCLCPVRTINITDQVDKPVGFIKDYFPGCNLRGCAGTADNFRLEFPEHCTPDMKAQLLASTILLDYMLFEKAEDDQNSNGLALM